MLKKVDLRLRYIISFSLLFLTVILFSNVLYESYRDNNIRDISKATLEKFTYAAGSVSRMTQPLDNLASVAGLEAAVTTNADGRVEAISDSQVFAAMQRLKSKIPDGIQMLFYICGSTDIYTENERMRYSLYEKRMKEEYNLALSQLYSRISKTRDYAMVPILKSDHSPGAVARIVPMSISGISNACTLIYILPETLISDEIERYMGELRGDFFLYDSNYVLLYARFAEAEPMLSFSQIVKKKGVGLLEPDGEHIMLVVSQSEYGMNYVKCDTRKSFYSEMESPLKQYLIRLLMVMGVLLVLFIWLLLFNYVPIRRLTNEITGRHGRNLIGDDLALIKDSYHRTIEEVEKLSDQVSSLAPLAIQQFLTRWVYGQIQDKSVFDTLARYSDISFPYRLFAAVCVLPNGMNMEKLAQLLNGFHPSSLVTLAGWAQDENALYLIVNYNDEHKDMLLPSVNQLRALLDKAGFEKVLLGVGTPNDNPLQIPVSFREAEAAVQLSRGQINRICFYHPEARDSETENDFQKLPPMAVSLMVSSIARGDSATARLAANEIIASMSNVTESLIFFRFYSGNLVGQILKAAEENQIHLSQTDIQPLVLFKTLQEFENNIGPFLENLCQKVRERHIQAEIHTNDMLMAYILAHFTDFDLSIQSVADATQLSRTQVAHIVREEMGLNFVQYVAYLRMNEFKRLLAETDRTISELITHVGYSDVSNFLRKFKATEGMTASQYRAQFHGQQ